VQGNLGAALQSLRRHSEALEAYRRACEFEFNDCNPRLRMNLATALEAGGDPKSTVATVARAAGRRGLRSAGLRAEQRREHRAETLLRPPTHP
jgi:Flp pilus assembly protein TadD